VDGPPAARLLQIAQNVEDLIVVGLLADVVDVDVADDSLLIDDDDRALADPRLLDPHAILLRDFSLRVKVCQERELLDPTERLREGYVTGNAIDRNAQNLGIIPLEFGVLRLVRGNLNGSHGGPVEGIEDQDHVLLPLKAAETNLLIAPV
jgi:hypothetical protein